MSKLSGKKQLQGTLAVMFTWYQLQKDQPYWFGLEVGPPNSKGKRKARLRAIHKPSGEEFYVDIRVKKKKKEAKA